MVTDASLTGTCSLWKCQPHNSSFFQVTPLPPLLGSGSATSSLYLFSLGKTTTSAIAHLWDGCHPLQFEAFSSHCIEYPALQKLQWCLRFSSDTVSDTSSWLCQNLRPGRQSTFGSLLSMQLIHGPVVQRRDSQAPSS